MSGDTARNILFWDLQTYEYFLIPVPFPAIKDSPNDAGMPSETADYFCFTPDGQRLVFKASSQEGFVHICQVNPAQKRLTLQKTLPTDGISGQVIAPNGKLLAIMQQDEVSVYDLESFQLLQTFLPTTFECVASFAAHPGLITYWTEPIGGLDWSRTGYIVTGGAGSFEKDESLKDYTIKIWKVEQ